MATETVKVTMEIIHDASGEKKATVTIENIDGDATRRVVICVRFDAIADALDAIAMLSDLLERMRK